MPQRTLVHASARSLLALLPIVQVADDIKSILRIPRCETFRHSINRPNIYYEVGTEHITQLVLQPGRLHTLWHGWYPSLQVQQREATSIPQTAQDILAWVGNHFEGKPTGIVYCLTR